MLISNDHGSVLFTPWRCGTNSAIGLLRGLYDNTLNKHLRDPFHGVPDDLLSLAKHGISIDNMRVFVCIRNIYDWIYSCWRWNRYLDCTSIDFPGLRLPIPFVEGGYRLCLKDFVSMWAKGRSQGSLPGLSSWSIYQGIRLNATYVDFSRESGLAELADSFGVEGFGLRQKGDIAHNSSDIRSLGIEKVFRHMGIKARHGYFTPEIIRIVCDSFADDIELTGSRFFEDEIDACAIGKAQSMINEYISHEAQDDGPMSVPHDLGSYRDFSFCQNLLRNIQQCSGGI